jgi:hypothetical protein
MALSAQCFHGFQDGSLAGRHRFEIAIAGHVGDLQLTAFTILSNLGIPGKARGGRISFTADLMRRERESDGRHSQNHWSKKSSHHSLAISDTEKDNRHRDVRSRGVRGQGRVTFVPSDHKWNELRFGHFCHLCEEQTDHALTFSSVSV